jgi:DNA repair protein RadA/Sms
MEGSRSIVVSVEALTIATKFGYPKRSSRGVSSARLDQLIAIIGRYTSVKLDSSDVYIHFPSDLSSEDPLLDLAIVAALISSRRKVPLGRHAIWLGEVSLTGDIRW